eukprot:Gb_09278 [translate_table: standard]
MHQTIENVRLPEAEVEKPRRSLRKDSTSLWDSVPAEDEAQKVRRSLRKISDSKVNSVSDHPDVEAQMPQRNWRSKFSKPSTSDSVSDQPSMQEVNIASNDEPEPVEHVASDEFDQAYKGQDTISVVHQALTPPESITGDDASSSQHGTESSVVNGDPVPIPIPIPIPTKLEHENGTEDLSSRTEESQVSVTEHKIGRRSIPSYMAATESAKAKLRFLASPSSSADVKAKGSSNSIRKSAASNGRQNSVYPRPQRLLPQVHMTRRNSKNDRSVRLAKDGRTGRVAQAYWPR